MDERKGTLYSLPYIALHYYSPVTHGTSKLVGYVIVALIIFSMFVRVLSRHTKSSNIYTQN